MTGLFLSSAPAWALGGAKLNDKGLASAILRAERQLRREGGPSANVHQATPSANDQLAALVTSLADPERAKPDGPQPAEKSQRPFSASNAAPLPKGQADALASLGLSALGTQLGDLVERSGLAGALPPGLMHADALGALIAAEDEASSASVGRARTSGQQLASLSPAPPPGLQPPAARPAPTALVLTMVGDVGLAENRRLRTAKSASAWASYTEDLKPLIDGDLNFLNLETVVTDRPLRARSKAFAFQTHDTALAHLTQDLGFNLLSLANNHSGDFRRAGQVATLAALKQHAPQAIHHGLGTSQELLKVREFRIKGLSIAFAAIGISSGAPRPEDDQPGQFFIRRDQDWQAVIRAFQDSDADLKILSIHEGQEKVSEAEGSLKRKLRQARDDAGVDLIVGHHPHVARALEQDQDGRLIAYSLGNGLLFGAANIDHRPMGRDFGLFLRLHYWFDGSKLALEAIEAVPLRGMHHKAKPRSARQAAKRIRFLNGLSARTAGKHGVKLSITKHGFGLWCGPQALEGARAKALCSN